MAQSIRVAALHSAVNGGVKVAFGSPSESRDYVSMSTSFAVISSTVPNAFIFRYLVDLQRSKHTALAQRRQHLALTVFAHPSMHHVRVQPVAERNPRHRSSRRANLFRDHRLEFGIALPPARPLYRRHLIHRLHDPPSWGRCLIASIDSRWRNWTLTTKGTGSRVAAEESGRAALPLHRWPPPRNSGGSDGRRLAGVSASSAVPRFASSSNRMFSVLRIHLAVWEDAPGPGAISATSAVFCRFRID
jgi:hypothetical protein